ncbi:hypothetical protein DSO57_1015720 [Entomophthora muscae]|uniref:Uncharacterized protein n=1 Tax=Entomophthora muscae TaxID=34485 RepID=A0ACC2RWA7_9FUNG|nr:hypothetical protein DSO57_1015720 [Entomophthora muscae]
MLITRAGGFLAGTALARRMTRIVGGTEVQPRFMYRFMVSLQLHTIHKCGGTWFRDSLVLTAAHCTKGEDLNHFVIIHRHDLSIPEQEEESTRHHVLGRIVHPHFDPETYQHDIAIWNFASPPNDPQALPWTTLW